RPRTRVPGAGRGVTLGSPEALLRRGWPFNLPTPTKRRSFMRKLVTLVAIFGLAVIAWSGGDALAQGPKGKGPPPPPPPPPGPAYVPLSVPGLRIASHQDLAVEAIDIAVSATRMTYTYRLANKGSAEL